MQNLLKNSVLLILLLLTINSIDIFSQNIFNFDSIVNFRNSTIINIKDTSNLRRTNKQLDRFINFRKNRLDNGNYPDIVRLYNEFQTKYKYNYNEKLQSINWEELGPMKIETDLENAGNGRVNCIAFNPLKEKEIWIGAASGGMWKSEDSGNSWKPIDMTQFMSIGISDIKFSTHNPNIAYAATGDADGGMFSGTYSIGIIKTSDNGQTWNITNFHNLSDGLLIYELIIHPNNENIVWAATNNGIIRTNDGGLNWFYEVTGNCFSSIKMHPENPEILYAGTAHWRGNTKIIRTTDEGKNWTEIAKFELINRIAISVNKKYPNNLYFIGSSLENSNLGLYMLSYNKGDTWINKTNRQIDMVHGQGFYNLVLFNDYMSDSSFFIGGIYLGYVDTKSTKLYYQNGPHVDFHCVVYNEHDSYFYCGTDGGIYRTRDPQNNKWENISNGLSIMQVYRATPNPFHSSNLMAGSQDNGVVDFQNEKWYNILEADGMECVYDNFIPAINYKSAQNGYIIRNNSEITLLKIYNINESKPWTTHYIAHHKNSGQIYFGFQNLYIYDVILDSLIKLSQFTDNKTITFFDVDKSDSDVIYIVRGSEVIKTIDGGKNWSSIFESKYKISSIVIHPEDNKIAYISLTGYDSENKVYEYKNGTWRNISFNLMNVPVNKIIIPNTNPDYLIIATDLGVFAKDTSANKWELFGSGIPNVIVNDIKINYASGYLIAGTWGRGIWKAKLWNCEQNKILIDIENTYNYVCKDSSIKVKVLNPQKDLIYLWSNGQTGTEVDIKESGEYFVSAFDKFGCVSNSNFFNVDSKSYNFNIFVDTYSKFCKGDTAILFVDVYRFTPIKYFWSIGDTTQSIKVTEDGQYYCTVEFANGCRNTTKIHDIKFNSKPSTPILSFNSKTNEIFLYNSSNSGILASVLWFKDGVKIETDEINQESIKIDSSGIYSAIIYDENYCNQTSEEIIIIIPRDFPIPVSINTTSIDGEYEFNTLLPSNSELTIELYDLNGKLITNESNNQHYGYYKSKFDLKNFAQSIYYLNIIYNNKHIKTIKLAN